MSNIPSIQMEIETLPVKSASSDNNTLQYEYKYKYQCLFNWLQYFKDYEWNGRFGLRLIDGNRYFD